MPQVIEKNSIMINKEPMVLLPLRQWKVMEDTIEDFEDAVRYHKALAESKDEALISLEEIKKKYKLK